MKLLFDQNLSFKLCQSIVGAFPESNHVGLLGLSQADDREVWDHAKANGFTIVSRDVDFAEMAAVFGPPPKVIMGACRKPIDRSHFAMAAILQLLRLHAELIVAFGNDSDAACLEIY